MFDSHTRIASRYLVFNRSLLFCLAFVLALLTRGLPSVAFDGLSPVHVRVLGHEVRCSTSPLSDGVETYAPLEVLTALGIDSKWNDNNDSVFVSISNPHKQAEIAVARPNGQPMVALSDVARFLDAQVIRPDYVGPDGVQIKGRRGDVVYVLARITDVHISDGQLYIHTTFPVPYHVRTVTDMTPNRGFVDWVGDSFHCTPLSSAETRVLKLRSGQNNAEIARIVVETAPGNRFAAADISTNNTPEIATRLESGNGFRYAHIPTPRPPTVAAPRAGDSVNENEEGAQVRQPTANADPSFTPTQTSYPRDDSTPIEVRGFTLNTNDSGIVQLDIATSAHAICYVRYEQDGRQLVVEINNAVLNLADPGSGEQTFRHPLISALHTATIQKNQPTTRVILDMKRVVGFNVNTQNNQISVDMRLPQNANPTGTTGTTAEKTIVVDAGHGGTSTGAKGYGNGVVYEKDITLAISLKLREALQSWGARVVMTRDRDVNVNLSERPQMANRIHADLFVSIHNNSNGVPNSASGTSTWYHMHDPNCRALAVCVQHEILKVSGLPNYGVLSDSIMYASGFAVLRESHMPAVLVEVAFINNSYDRNKLTDPDFQERVAQAISRGIRQYIDGSSQTASNSVYAQPMALLSASASDPTEEVAQ